MSQNLQMNLEVNLEELAHELALTLSYSELMNFLMDVDAKFANYEFTEELRDNLTKILVDDHEKLRR